jgi:hypothetical protein
VKTFIERNVDEISTTLELCVLTKADNIVASIFSGKVSKPGSDSPNDSTE